MFTNANTILLHAITPVHVGSGSEVGHVDLPIQRERHTGYPKIESSSLKGTIRHYFESQDHKKEKLEAVFGSAEEQDETQASAASFSDARVLLFPVRSVKEVFVWITCPNVLERFNREMTLYDENFNPLPVPKENTVVTEQLIVSHNQLILEEYAYEVSFDDATKQLAEQLGQLVETDLANDLEKRLVVLSDEQFAHFVQLSTEINARTRLDDVGENKGLWYEENVPAETIFYATIFCGQERVKHDSKKEKIKSAEQIESFVKDNFPKAFQVGGNHTLARGLMKTMWIE